MQDSGHILVINLGSTSTKLGVFQFQLTDNSLSLVEEVVLDHSTSALPQGPVLNQLEFRLKAVRNFIASTHLVPDIIMARGAPLQPMIGGIYAVNKEMLEDIRLARYADHASNLAALIGAKIGAERDLPVYISDPITLDEFEPLARISGVPGIERKSRSHALNIKAVTRKVCSAQNKSFSSSNWVVCHMGGGISVAALKNGRIIDVNDALLGMGPFGPERAGALPISALLSLAYSGEYNQAELATLLSRKSGLVAYLGTADLREVEHRIENGDDQAELIFQAMAYQIAKEIASMASVLFFNLNGIVLTGGMAHSDRLCSEITRRIQKIASIYIEPGEYELEALAQAGLRVLSGKETVRNYCSEKPHG